jgi:2-succinyl-5-enolpyruvyl-6-hydroxy-3-cyclohexene-1-carboxylate synthase
MSAGHSAHAAWLDRYVAANPSQAAPNVELARSTDVGDMREFARTELAASRSAVTRELLVDALWRASWPHDRLVLGASRLIRVADRILPGKKIPVFANRGLAGIDGTIATASGIALASGALTRVLLGDLAALHDAGAMLFGPLEQRPRIHVFVANDGGGTIFDSLELVDQVSPELVDRGFYTPHGANFAALAQAYGWSHTRVETVAELERALTASPEDAHLIEVVIAR